LPTILRKRMADAEARTAANTRMTLVLAVAYGGQWDMVQAVRRISQKVRSGDLDPADIDEALIDRHRALAGLPSPDLLIRTGGEQRVSNFLLWDLAYTELCFTDTLWPDFGTDQITAALEDFSQRQRRFGRTGDQLEAIAD
jgi:undecaprenyl diphosphate synthase